MRILKIGIVVIATVFCILGGKESVEPANYVLWWLMFVLVLLTDQPKKLVHTDQG